VTQLNPAQFRLLLAGPRVSRLLPFFTSHGYVAEAAASGGEALERMRAAPRHVLLAELELGDMMLSDLLKPVQEGNLAGSIILLEDPVKSGLIVSTLLRGIDSYVATPPDELHLFRLVDRQLLAQWALAQSDESDKASADVTRLEKQLLLERMKVTELVKQIAALRDEAAEIPTGRTARPPGAASARGIRGRPIAGFDDDSASTAIVPTAPKIPPEPSPPTIEALDDLDDLVNLVSNEAPPVVDDEAPTAGVLRPAQHTDEELEEVRGSLAELLSDEEGEDDLGVAAGGGLLDDDWVNGDAGATFDEPTSDSRESVRHARGLISALEDDQGPASFELDKTTQTPSQIVGPSKRPTRAVPARRQPSAEETARLPAARDVGFEEAPRTVQSPPPAASLEHDRQEKARRVASAAARAPDQRDSDLFLDLEDSTLATDLPSASTVKPRRRPERS
jgi:hypothetical protein